MSTTLCTFTFHNFNVEDCILQLVNLSISKKASSIAVRFHPKDYKIQIVDNGIGFTKQELAQMFTKQMKDNYINDYKSILQKIKCLSNAVILTSRQEYSNHTYVKIASSNYIYKTFKGYHRPSKGTTITIYNFNSLKWNNVDKDCSITYTIASVAFTELKVSFSLRNDESKEMLFIINKPHTPWDVLKYLNNSKSSSLSFEPICQKLQENPKNNFQEIEQYTKVATFNKSNISNVLSSDCINAIDYSNNLSPISEWSNWSYHIKNSIFNENNNNNQININWINMPDDNFINLTQMSVWSDWIYHPEDANVKDNIRLPYTHAKLLNDRNVLESSQYQSYNIFNCAFNFNMEEAYFKYITNVRARYIKQICDECKVTENTINSLQILKQVNKEFIIGIANENGKKILIIIDQHAAHERIRYEWLIETYRDQKTNKYYYANLDKDLLIPDFKKDSLDIIITHKEVFKRFGINIKSVVDTTSLIVNTAPKCFVRKIKGYNNNYNLYRLRKKVKDLILEITNGLKISDSTLLPVLPITINNVIASEACHEAIKFGDPLNVEQCILLIQTLKDTKTPTRCAHGRPSIIPLIDLTELQKRKFPVEKKLNFNSLIHYTNINKKINKSTLYNETDDI